MKTMTPTTMRMILRALLPPLEGGGPGVIGWAEAGAPVTALPHLLQNFVPSLSGAPQELQNAMLHLVGCLTGEYIAHWDGFEGEFQAERGA